MKEQIKIGNHYKAIGYSGMSDGKEVCGMLINYNEKHNDAVLTDGRYNYAVIFKSLVLIDGPQKNKQKESQL